MLKQLLFMGTMTGTFLDLIDQSLFFRATPSPISSYERILNCLKSQEKPKEPRCEAYSQYSRFQNQTLLYKLKEMGYISPACLPAP